MKKILLGIVAAIFLIVVIVALTEESPSSPPPTTSEEPSEDTSQSTAPEQSTPETTTETTPDQPEPTPDEAEAEAVVPVEYSFEGTGDSLTAPFDLRQGLVVLTLQHKGEENFIVELLPEGAGHGELTVNTIGTYSGIRVHPVNADALMGLEPGEYRIEVKADGSWDIALNQPVFTKGAAPPLSFQGVGDGVTDVIQLDAGTVPVDLSHTGTENFIVHAYSTDGRNAELMVNEIGDYDGTVALRVQPGAIMGLEPGLHVIAIQADGSWSVQVGE